MSLYDQYLQERKKKEQTSLYDTYQAERQKANQTASTEQKVNQTVQRQESRTENIQPGQKDVPEQSNLWTQFQDLVKPVTKPAGDVLSKIGEKYKQASDTVSKTLFGDREKDTEFRKQLEATAPLIEALQKKKDGEKQLTFTQRITQLDQEHASLSAALAKNPNDKATKQKLSENAIQRQIYATYNQSVNDPNFRWQFDAGGVNADLYKNLLGKADSLDELMAASRAYQKSTIPGFKLSGVEKKLIEKYGDDLKYTSGKSKEYIMGAISGNLYSDKDAVKIPELTINGKTVPFDTSPSKTEPDAKMKEVIPPSPQEEEITKKVVAAGQTYEKFFQEFTSGMTGGFVQPQYVQDHSTSEMVAAGVGQVLGTAAGIVLTAGAFEALAAGSGLTSAISKYPRFSKYVYPFLKNIAVFDAFGQLNPDLKDRFSQLGKDTLTAIPFTIVGGVKSAKISIPASFGLGFGLAKLDGADNKDALISGAILAVFDGVARGSAKASGFMEGRATEKVVKVEAVDVLNTYSGSKLKTDASMEEISKAYRTAAAKTHPDVGGNPDDFRKVTAAYEWLSGKNSDVETFKKATESQVETPERKTGEAPKSLPDVVKEEMAPKPAEQPITAEKPTTPLPSSEGETPLSQAQKPQETSGGVGESKPIKPEYFIHTNTGFSQVDAEKITVVKGIDTFVHKTTNGEQFAVSEGRSGKQIGVGDTRQAAIDNAKEMLINNEGEVKKVLDLAVQTDGESPRYKATEQDKLKEQFRASDDPVQKENEEYLLQNLDKAKKDYYDRVSLHYDTPNVISADDAKYILPGFEAKQSSKYHSAASSFSKYIYDEKLVERKGKGDNTVVFLSGGTGSGKTTALKNAKAELKDAAIIYDTNLTGRGATTKIDKALAAGFNVEIDYVQRDPVVAFTEGVIPRVRTEGRLVSIAEHIDRHAGAFKTLEEIKAKYGDKVQVRYIDNTGERGTAKVIPFDKLPKYDYNKNELERKLHEELNKARKENKVTSEEANAISESGQKSASPSEQPKREPPSVTPNTTKTKANRAPFADLENLSTNIAKDQVKVIEFPEIMRFAEELMGGNRPIATSSKRGKWLGVFRPKGEGQIELKTDIFKTPGQAAKVLSHEVGHLMDYLPEGTMKRGNLVGRIASLNKYLKNVYGDLDNKVVRKELMDLSAKWRLVEGGNGTAADLQDDAYRKASDELYADAISVLFNDPVRLKQEAPAFWKGFFDNLDSKPEVKEDLFEVYETLNGDPDKLFRERDKAMSESFKKAEDAFYAVNVENQKRKSNLWVQIRTLIDDKNFPVIAKTKEAIKKGEVIEDSKNPIFGLAGLNYTDSKVKNYIEDTFQPVFEKAQSVPDGWNTLGKVLQLERTIYERGEMANPGGYDPKTAADQLKALEEHTPKEDWETIQEAKQAFRAGVQRSISDAEKGGYYSPEMLEIMKANPAYATYQVIDYLDTHVSAGVHQSVGTLKDIANPATSTVMKTISLVKALERNKVKVDVVDMLTKAFPDEITASKLSFNGKSQTVVETREKGKGTVILIKDGKPTGYDLDKSIADSLNYTSHDTIRSAAQVMRMVSLSPFYRPLFTTVNLGFQSFNFVRDFERYWKNIPDQNLGEAITSLPRAIFRYGQAVPHAANRALNRPDTLIKEMQNSKMLGLQYNDIFKDGVYEEDKQIERVLQGVGILETTRKLGWKKAFLPLYKTLEGVELMGNFIESLPKVAGYIELKGKMPPEELAHFIRTKIGSPDFRTSGSMTPITNNIFMFSNAIKEGIKSDIQIAKGSAGRKSQAGFWWKTVLGTLLPKIIMAGIGLGFLGEKIKEQMDGVSEYDKTSYTVIPLGLDENGKTKYLRIPQDETSRVIGSLFWKMLNMGTKKEAGIDDFFQIIDVGAGQLPNLSPSFTNLGVILQYMAGQNPYDSFRGRNVIPDREFQAGPKYSLPILVDWLAKSSGLGIIAPSYSPDNPTNLEKALNFPVVSNILGRWVKVSDYGKSEKLKEVTKDIEQQTAASNVEQDKIIADRLASFQKSGDKSITGRLKFERETFNAVTDILTEAQRTPQKLAAIKKEIHLDVVKGNADSNLNSLIYANTVEQKAQILKTLSGGMSQGDFTTFMKQAEKDKVISKNVVKRYRELNRK